METNDQPIMAGIGKVFMVSGDVTRQSLSLPPIIYCRSVRNQSAGNILCENAFTVDTYSHPTRCLLAQYCVPLGNLTFSPKGFAIEVTHEDTWMHTTFEMAKEEVETKASTKAGVIQESLTMDLIDSLRTRLDDASTRQQ